MRSTSRAVRVLGVCGIVSAALSTASGFLAMPFLLGIAGAVMLVGNVYALTHRRVEVEE